MKTLLMNTASDAVMDMDEIFKIVEAQKNLTKKVRFLQSSVLVIACAFITHILVTL